jgi:hypothetical protein
MALPDHPEKIVELPKETGFNDDFFKKARQSLEAATSVLKPMQTQTALFAHFLISVIMKISG